MQENNNDVVRMLLAKKEVDINVANVSAQHAKRLNHFYYSLMLYIVCRLMSTVLCIVQFEIATIS